MGKPVYQYEVEIYRAKGRKWEARVRLAHGKRNVIFTSHGQGYNRSSTALRIARNLFATGYGVRFLVQQDNGAFAEVRPWK